VSELADEPSEQVAGRSRTYLDAGSTEPLRPVARDTLLAALDQGWADPLRLHSEARRARMMYDNAREAVAAVLGCRPDEVSFTSSGTTAVHTGLVGLLRRPGVRLLHSAVEHSSVLHVARQHAGGGGAVVPLEVARDGSLDPTVLVAALDAALDEGDGGDSGDGGDGDGGRDQVVAVQAANLESGAVHPADEIAEACAAAGARWFVDAAAIVGRVPMPSGWSVAAASAHKWGGPAGVGVLAIRRGARWRAHGVADERLDPRSPGYENVPAAVAAAAALQEMWSDAADRAARQRALRDRLRARIATIPDVELIGPEDAGLPHVVAASFLYVDGEVLVTELDRRGFAVASGSACTASSLEPSHVLAAMGVLTHGNVRVSLTADSAERDVDAFADALADVVATTRERLGPL
jgi:cysteine desulfurase